MIFKKIKKTIFGVELNAAESKALDDEIHKRVIDYVDAVNNDICVMILYRLHTRYHFGKKRLKEFKDGFDDDILNLVNYYELNKPGDDVWLCRRMLKEDGINVDEL